MKKLITICLVAGLILGIGGNAALGVVTVNYGGLTLSPSWTAGHFNDIWNLTAADLTLSYTIDMRAVTQDVAYNTSYTEVGIRQVGSGDFNPGPFGTYQGGKGGWMTSLVGDLAPSPGTQSLMDKHNLSASGGRGETDYDATASGTIVSPIGSSTNYGIWFDRDSVDQWQAGYWGSVNGGTYNTGGIYDIAITYHAISSTLGTMFATVNGIPTGFYADGWVNAQPDYYPAGLSFKGDMTQMQVFTGLWAPSGVGGDVLVSDITVTGVPEPATMTLLGLGALSLLRRKR